MNPRLTTLLTNYPALVAIQTDIEVAAELLLTTFQQGQTLLLCGNGGSASDADHIAGELLKGFQHKRPLREEHVETLGEELASKLEQGLPAIPLTAFPALNTAYGNDVDGEYGFAQLVWALGRPGDTLLALSTSGNSTNVIHALKAARAAGMNTLGLTGESGGKMKELCTASICVPSSETFRIQEFHLPIYHALCLMVEDALFRDPLTE